MGGYTFSGVGSIAGHRIAYVRTSSGKIVEFTPREFRAAFGVSCAKLTTGAPLCDPLPLAKQGRP